MYILDDLHLNPLIITTTKRVIKGINSLNQFHIHVYDILLAELEYSIAIMKEIQVIVAGWTLNVDA